jgi:hypothetical protein
MIVVDTNVLSEAMRERPELRVVAWLKQQPVEETFTTVITKAEVLYGIELLPHGKNRAALTKAAESIFAETFSGRVLAFEEGSARYYAEIAATRRARGRPIEHPDAEIAAIARLHGATLATRNARDFADCGVRVVNPWEA